MGAIADFRHPAWTDPVDEGLDWIRENYNFLLCCAANGAVTLPGWNTEVNIASNNNYAEPDGYILTRGTREIRINLTWTDGSVSAVQICYHDGVSSPGLYCFDEVTLIEEDVDGFSTTAKHFGDGSSPVSYYVLGNSTDDSPKVWAGGLIPSTGSGDAWQEMTLVFCVYVVEHDDDRVFIFSSGQGHFNIGTNNSDGGLWLAGRDASTNTVQNVNIAASGSPSDGGGLPPGEWHSVMISAVNYMGPGAKIYVEVYIDGSEVFSGDWNTSGDTFNPMDYTGPSYVGAGDFPSGTAPGPNPDFWEGLNCYLSYVWCKEQYLDPAIYWSSFFDGDNKPIDIGEDGSSVTGAAPDSYFPDADFTNNRGTGPNWTEVGTVPAAPSSPTD